MTAGFGFLRTGTVGGPSALPEGDSRFAQVVRSDLDVDPVPDADADEVLAHLTRNVGEHLVTVGQCHPEHRSRQDLGHAAFQFNWLFFGHSKLKSISRTLGSQRGPETGAA